MIKINLNTLRIITANTINCFFSINDIKKKKKKRDSFKSKNNNYKFKYINYHNLSKAISLSLYN